MIRTGAGPFRIRPGRREKERRREWVSDERKEEEGTREGSSEEGEVGLKER